MASEAVYAGLAAGGNELASIMREKRKAELEAKLMAEREARAEQRETAREARAEARRLKQPARRELDPARGVIVVYNSEDEVLKEIPATAAELEKASFESRKNAATLAGLEGSLADAEWERGHRDEDRALKLKESSARLGLIGAQTASAARRGVSADDEDSYSISDIVEQGLKRYGNMLDEWGEADAEGKKTMPESQKRSYIKKAAEDAARYGISDFDGLLMDIVNSSRGIPVLPKAAATGGGTSFGNVGR